MLSTYWAHRRFTLLDTHISARIKDLAKSSQSSPRSYLGELIEMICYEQRTKIDDCPTVVDELVAAWIAAHRSGLPPERTPLQIDDCLTYPVGRLESGPVLDYGRCIAISEYFL